MATTPDTKRPPRVVLPPLAPLPDVSGRSDEQASTEYSHYRTGLSRHRTDLSEHRTGLSEYRTDLSDHRTELSMRRTGMSIQRTRMSADRTLMSVVRTALSLIGFGFTIYQAFEKLHRTGVMEHSESPRNFGLTLITIGVILLLGGIINHARFGLELRGLRSAMASAGLVYADTPYPVSVTFICALLLLMAGLAAAASILFNFALFG
ncbi:MAG: hypothetical protein C0481_03865 [Phenylobacterium sp.]|uniref:YidH family protein n=1 Tax=Phenylobacterium sp. TaxID=1871053 RepID=UPI0025CE1685|nr:DUF202 domain-containing protein [Phenylobacterium sp.]MBA4010980.1 hypothetical protein [Phenylobacterium sp.]